MKMKIGIFSFTSCMGCELQILNSPELLEIIEAADITYFEVLQERKEKKVDAAFVEGCISKASDVREIKEIRANAKYLIALGTCAVYGGIPALKNLYKGWEVERIVYTKGLKAIEDAIPPRGIGEYVKVDYNMRGCPIEKSEFIKVFRSLAMGVLPKEPKAPVCAECVRRQNDCLLRKYGEPCMGVITHSGCKAICPSNRIPCYGCRGPTEESNVEAFVNILSKYHPREEISRVISTYTAAARKFKKYVE